MVKEPLDMGNCVGISFQCDAYSECHKHLGYNVLVVLIPLQPFRRLLPQIYVDHDRAPHCERQTLLQILSELTLLNDSIQRQTIEYILYIYIYYTKYGIYCQHFMATYIYIFIYINMYVYIYIYMAYYHIETENEKQQVKILDPSK